MTNGGWPMSARQSQKTATKWLISYGEKRRADHGLASLASFDFGLHAMISKLWIKHERDTT